MRKRDGKITYSASDLLVFLESPFASWMDRQLLEVANAPTPDPNDPEDELWEQKGRDHERVLLAQLSTEVGEVWSPSEGDPFVATVAAMREGRRVIYQGHLRAGQFEGHPDFLVRTEVPSSVGPWSYMPVEAKLAQQPVPRFLLQLCAYADLLDAVQGVRPDWLQLLTGDGAKHQFRAADFFYYYRCLKQAFESSQEFFSVDNCPLPDKHANHRHWRTHAAALLTRLDHPSLVANSTRHQIHRLAQAGVSTMTGLAECGLRRIPKLDDDVYLRLRDQATLQIMSRGTSPPEHRILPIPEDNPRSGLALLPPPSSLDVYFDMEGFPLVTGGLEYLFGAFCVERGAVNFTDFWAHDRAAERLAFEQFIDWAYGRFQSDRSMHIYHYGFYEISAVRRLMGFHATREEQVDVLLRNEVFVDLYRVVRQGVRIGEPRYSLKNVEHLYRGAREGGVTTASQSMVEYARWLQERDGDSWQSSTILRRIRDYNREDCESTWQLATWLRDRQRDGRIAYVPPKPRPPDEESIPAKWQPSEAIARALQKTVLGDSPKSRLSTLLAQLVTFHWRESKPVFWALHNYREMTVDERREDPDCLADVRRTDRRPEVVRESLLYEYAFDPEQDTSIRAGTRCEIFPSEPRMRVEVHAMEPATGRLTFLLGERRTPPADPFSLIPYEYVDPEPIAASLRRTSDRWLQHQSLPPAVEDLLLRRPPRVHGGRDPASHLIADDSPALGQLEKLLGNLDSTCLAIQGPPGTGKTYTAAALIIAAIRTGKRVAVSSNSHKAIEKLMLEAHKTARRAGVDLRGAKIGDDGNAKEQADGFPFPRVSAPEVLRASPPPSLVGATAWALSTPEFEGAFDYLFIDEAGQVSLANLVGMAPCARNLILVGDQMQLSQVSKGSHPGESGLSALAFMLAGHATVPANMGIFLNVSRRLHPDLCHFISDAVYEGRLQADSSTRARRIRLRAGAGASSNFPSSGLAFVAVPHEGNTRSSDEEVAAVVAIVTRLMEYDLTRGDGEVPRAITPADIIVVAPYNAQVHLLHEALPNLPVGTVDRFQGQEAPIVILSMCSSAGEQASRGTEFLLNTNRLNVALSRAQVVSIVVAHPDLVRTRVGTIDQLKRVNLLCRIVSEAAHVTVPDIGHIPAPQATPLHVKSRGPEKQVALRRTKTQWTVDENVLANFVSQLKTTGDSRDWFDLRRDAELLALTPSFDRLITLDCNRIDELPHQITVAQQVLRRPMSGRALLADEVGLGKTIEAAIIYTELQARGLVHRVLILTPAALVEQWREELASKFFEQFETPQEPEDWDHVTRAVVSYDRARTALHTQAILRHRWDLIIVDEAHKVKNHETQTYKFLQQVERNFILLLTATPLQNNLRELYNLVTLLRPGQLGTWKDFRRRYVQGGDPRKAKNPDALRDLTSQVMVRTRRSNVAALISLPPRRPHQPAINLSPEEADLYRDTTAFLRDLYKNGFYQPDEDEAEEDRARKRRYTGQGNLSRIMMLLCQRLCSSSAALAESLDNLAEGELILPEYRARAIELGERARSVRVHAKLEVLSKLLTDSPERFIVFTEHLPTIRVIEGRVKELGRTPIVFAGQVPRLERNARIGRFRQTDGAVFLATRAGSEGLNLQDGCSRIVNYELPWNPMIVEQRIGRVHRIGQRNEVHIYNFAASQTIETHVLRLLDQKIKLFELVVGELDVILGGFGEPEDLEKQLRKAWLSSGTDAEFETKVTEIGDAITASRQDGLEHERIASEVAAEDPGTRLAQEFASLTIPARVRLGYGTVHLTHARGVEAKRTQLGLRVPEIIEALAGMAVAQVDDRHPDFGSVYRVVGRTQRGRRVVLTVKADSLPMLLVDIDSDLDATAVAEGAT